MRVYRTIGPLVNLLCSPIFKIHVAHFRTVGMQMDDKFVFVSGCFRTR